jgi:cytochrome c biogenesis protein CcmG/thiol:disulfide interchange protein DsbE
VNTIRLSAAVPAALLGVLLGGCSSNDRVALSVREQRSEVKAESKRNVAADFSLKDIDGKTVKLSDYRGKVVLLDFWATWCGPCKIEIPWFIDMQRRLKDRGFAVIGVSMDEEGWEVVKPFLAQMNVNYRVVIGSDSVAQSYGGIEALPTTFLIDREGRIAATHVGLNSRKDFEDGIQQLLESPTPVGGGTARVALPASAVGTKRVD